MQEDDSYVVKGPQLSETIPNVSAGKLLYDHLLAHCNEDEALVDALTGECISYKQLLFKTCSLAESLRRSGYVRNDVISICSENCIEYLIPVISALYIGITVVPINNNYTKSELVHALNISKPKIIFCSKDVCSQLVDLKRQLTYIENIIIMNSKEDFNNIESIDSFIKRLLQTSNFLFRFDTTAVNVDNDVAFILYSSGTIGLPKGVMLTHKNVVAQAISSDISMKFCKEGGSVFLFLPFFHAYGVFMGYNAIYKSSKIVLIKKFEENLFLRTIEKYEIQALPLVPSVAIFLAKHPLVEKYDVSSVKDILSGGSSLSKDVEQMIKRRLKVDVIRQGYGLTELTAIGTVTVFGEEKFGSVGKVFSGTLCKIRHPASGMALGPNQVGEICFKGPTVMKGYCGNDEATRNTITPSGWLLTGDLGYYDEKQCFYLVGRLKELIKYKGFQVPPAELEAIILTNPKIKDVAVVGLPDETAGELPLAFVVKNSNVELTEKQVEQFLNERVSPQKKLRGGVIFISEIPKNPSGKILRRELHNILKKRLPSKH